MGGHASFHFDGADSDGWMITGKYVKENLNLLILLVELLIWQNQMLASFMDILVTNGCGITLIFS